MIIGTRIAALRLERKLTQVEIGKRTGLVRSYISRVEKGHTVPNLESLKKFAAALEVPLYFLVYEGEKPPEVRAFLKSKEEDGNLWGSSGPESQELARFQRALARMDEDDRDLLLRMARTMVGHKERKEGEAYRRRPPTYGRHQHPTS